MRSLETGPAWTTVHADDTKEAKVEVVLVHEIIIVESQDVAVAHRVMIVTSGESVLAILQVEHRKGPLIEERKSARAILFLYQINVSVRSSSRISVIGHLKFETQLKNNRTRLIF